MRKFSYIQFICLIGFQVLLFYAFLSRLSETDHDIHGMPTLLRMTFPSDDETEIFSGDKVLYEWKATKKKFITVDLTGEKDEDEKRIDFIRMEARRLKYTYDTTDILKVHFTEENTYGQFVQLVNIMVEDRHKRYMLYKDDFYILGEPPPLDE